jgi:AcrR family transcriptional regulator
LDGLQGFGERIMTATSTPPATAPPATVPPTTGPPTTGAPASLRERKKAATRLLLRRTALELVAERGLANVTVEDIAEAAEVSPRTFFNYFPSKEAVLFGGDADRAAALRAAIVSAVPGQPALDALRLVLRQDSEAMAGELRSLGGNPAEWVRRMKVARTDPHVRAAHAAQMSMIERAIADGLAARLGTDQETDPYPGILAAAAVSMTRACLTFWAGTGGAMPLGQVIDQAFKALADGFPENSDLRRIMTSVTPATPAVPRKESN